ncbi:hypothetical protein A2Y85_03870 [candidate division WOR-3 bacterium RBG_13_43_14]|uniref:FlgD Ig-like domain-containing protein n=1 Tax=candidate division WOR-3 bacterium RBG_13_43_14 TaxID=1802590 RepID=A0A1F4U473_UNCW3|nr:MAG: hypothetical protein A2Y85_03870 [candidate division WOR-3 bacterium RBG_13_43_14]
MLNDFLVWGISSYPAKRYFVVLWDHGSGWTLQPRRTFGSDWSSGNQMSIAGGDLNRALSYMNAATGENIDLLIFDACLMQQIEVAAEVADYAKILAGFQTLCPAPGLNYRRFIGELNSQPGMNENELASIMVETSVEEYKDLLPVSVGAFDLHYLTDLMDKLNSVVDIVSINIPPSAPVIDLRSSIQTIPSASNDPSTDDDFVDLGDLITGWQNTLLYPEIDDLAELYHKAIVSHGYWGDVYSRTSGMTIWYPLNYHRFKSLIDYYQPLKWSACLWSRFLNWWYNSDDIRPLPVNINAIKHGKRIDLNWTRAFDLAPVKYYLLEGLSPQLIFNDSCENDEQLYLQGFDINVNNPYSGVYSLFSGNASDLDNIAWTKEPIKINKTGLLVMQLHYNTEDLIDSLIVEYGSFKDIFYGNSSGWKERRVVLPAGNSRLRIRYRTNPVNNRGGAYIDDIFVYDLDECRFLRTEFGDTNLMIYNPLYGDRNYAVYAIDPYSNISNLSNFSEIMVDEYADPFSIPNPFTTACVIILDYPDRINPTVEIFSVDGRRIRKYGSEVIDEKRVYWDGNDEGGNICGAGLYYVLVIGDDFKKIGKIARQR